MENNVSFTAEENAIRKKWLFWGVKTRAYWDVFFILAYPFYYLIAGAPIQESVNLPSSLEIFKLPFSITIFILMATVAALSLYIPYYCAYKKYGTIFLFLYLIISPIIVLAETYKFLFFLVLCFKTPNGYFIFDSIFNFLFLIIELRSVYLSYKLRKINKNMRQKILESSKEYVYAASIFSLAQNMEELEKNYTDLFLQDESSLGRHRISHAYEARKKILKNS